MRVDNSSIVAFYFAIDACLMMFKSICFIFDRLWSLLLVH